METHLNRIEGVISIHALHEESDSNAVQKANPYFAFQSTLSMRRATNNNIIREGNIMISIHALHEESDPCQGTHPQFQQDFNPRSP